MPRVRKRLDLKVPPLRLFDDPMGHEGHSQAGQRDAPKAVTGFDGGYGLPSPANGAPVAL